MQKKYLICFISWILCLPLVVLAKSNSVQHYHLSNGLQLFVQSSTAVPVVVTQVWYKVGGSYEHNGTTGVSHLVEHMMFRGTTHHPGASFFKQLSSYGSITNAATSADYTVFYEESSINRLAADLALEADRMQNLNLKEQDFAKEHHIVEQERHMRVDNDPDAQTLLQFNAIAFLTSPYRHPVIGWRNDLHNLTLQDVRHWYQLWYHPNNAIVVVVGDVKPQQVYQLVKKDFGKIKAAPIPKLKPRIEMQASGPRQIIVKLPARLPLLIVGYNTPSLKTAQQSWQAYALAVIAGILDDGPSGRLPRDLVRGKQIASSVAVNYDLYSRQSSLFLIEGIPNQQHTIATLKASLLQEIKRLQTKPVSNEELQQVKRELTVNQIYQQDSLLETANQIGSLESVGLPWTDKDRFAQRINAVTSQQIELVAKRYLAPQKIVVAILQPQPLGEKNVKQKLKQAFKANLAVVH